MKDDIPWVTKFHAGTHLQTRTTHPPGTALGQSSSQTFQCPRSVINGQFPVERARFLCLRESLSCPSSPCARTRPWAIKSHNTHQTPGPCGHSVDKEEESLSSQGASLSSRASGTLVGAGHWATVGTAMPHGWLAAPQLVLKVWC